jgi:ATP-dependent Lon protease
MSPMSAEATVVRNYIETLIGLPWRKKTRISKDLAGRRKSPRHRSLGSGEGQGTHHRVSCRATARRQAQGADPVPGRPPGVGKTSLGQSIARATNRKFVRMSLGGVRDEAEIRGHRRTYIGSMPGKILQNMTKVGVKNPLFLLDEVDKMGQDFRGDPSSALLEVLDPEQNSTFVDHYVEVDYDLSDVMFVATANTLNIPAPLLDRMEVIRLSGYTEDEKVNIAQRYLLPKQMKNNGSRSDRADGGRERAARHRALLHPRGRRASLERDISKICRKVVKTLLLKKRKRRRSPSRAQPRQVPGRARYNFGVAEKENQVGQVTGLAWTEVGGELLTIERWSCRARARP